MISAGGVGFGLAEAARLMLVVVVVCAGLGGEVVVPQGLVGRVASAAQQRRALAVAVSVSYFA